MRAHFVALIALALSAPLHARDWYLSPAGSDNGNGSQAQPLRSIGRLLDPANALLSAGDRLILRGPLGNATFNETELRLRLPLTLMAFAGESPRIVCPLNEPDGVCIQIDPEASGSVISGLDIAGGNLYGIFLQTDWEQGGAANAHGASNIVIEDCKVHDSGRDAIKITPKSNNVTIRRCEIYNSGRIYPAGTPLNDRNAEGIDNVQGSGMRVLDSYIHDISTSGIYFKGGATDVVIERNRVERTGVAGILVGFDTSPEFFDLTQNPQYYEAIRGVVRNNIVRDTDYAGIGLYASRDALVANNTVIDTAKLGHGALYFGVTLQDFDPAAGRPANLNPRIVNNLVVQSASRGACVAIRFANELGGLSGLSGASGIDYGVYSNAVGCRFVDQRPGSPIDDGGNFGQWRQAVGADAHSNERMVSLSGDGHLPAGSAAIDAGLSLPEVTDDIDRQTRTPPQDIGADEFGATSGPLDEPSLRQFVLPTPAPANANCPSGYFTAVVDDGPGTGLTAGAFGVEVLLDEPGTRVLAGGLNFGGLIDSGQVGFAGFTIANAANEAQRLNLSVTGSPSTSSPASLPVRIRIVRRTASSSDTVLEATPSISLASPYVSSIDLPPAFYAVTVEPTTGAAGGAPEGQFLFSLTTSFVNRPGGGFQGGAVVGGYHATHPFGGVSGFAGFCLATPHSTSIRVLSQPSYGPTGAKDLRLRIQDAQQRDVVVVPTGL